MKYLDKIYNFLATNDFPTLLASMRELDWDRVLKSGYTWLVVLPVLGALIWTKSIKTIVALVSVFLFLLLVQHTLSPAKEALQLNDLLTFIGGAAALVGVNIYFSFIRQ
jgi:hypothetical protein